MSQCGTIEFTSAENQRWQLFWEQRCDCSSIMLPSVTAWLDSNLSIRIFSRVSFFLLDFEKVLWCPDRRHVEEEMYSVSSLPLFFSSLYRYHKIITLLPAGKFNINRLLGLTFNSSEDCLFDFFSLYLVLLSTVITVTEINELPASYPNCFVIPKITCFRNRHRYRIFYSIW